MSNEDAWRFSRTNGIVVVQNNGKERQKKVLQVQICVFAN